MFINFFFRFKEEYPESNVFDTPQCHRLESFFKRFLKAQELGYLGDLSEVHFPFSFLSSIENLKSLMVGIMEEIELVDEEEEESIKRFKSFFFKFRRKLNINKETYEEFYQTLEDYRYIQGHVRLNLRDLYNTGYSSEDVAGIYCQAQRDEDRYEIDSDSDSDGVIYVLSSSDSESETESESESD